MVTYKFQPLRHKKTGAALVGLCLLASCTRTIYVPQVETKTEYRDRVTHDTTIVEKEKVLYEKGDTIYLTITKNVYRVSVQRDTILVRDSIPVPYEVIKVDEVPRKKTTWEKTMTHLGEACLFAGVFMAILFAIHRKR